MAMPNEEAARILDPETSHEALAPWLLDCEGRMAVVEEACRMGAKALRAQLEVEQRPQWVSVSERLPENMAWVLCLCADAHIRVLRYDCGAGVWALSVSGGHAYSFPREAVTHWMPLPESPKEEE